MPVKTNKLLLLAGHARARAEEALAQAETFKDAEARRMLRKIAADYEKLAQRLEQQTDADNKA